MPLRVVLGVWMAALWVYGRAGAIAAADLESVNFGGRIISCHGFPELIGKVFLLSLATLLLGLLK